MNNAALRRLRWRLVLGSTAEASMGGLSGSTGSSVVATRYGFSCI
jgi:hypothetical protein